MEGHEDVFQAFDIDEKRSKAGSISDNGRAWTRRPSHRTTGRENEGRGQTRINWSGLIVRIIPSGRDRAVLFDVQLWKLNENRWKFEHSGGT